MAMTSGQHTGDQHASSQQPRVLPAATGEMLVSVQDTEAGVARREADAAAWVTYGGLLLLILGAMHVLLGIVAIVFEEWPVWASREVLLLGPGDWGWVHLGVGLVVGLAGLGVLTGSPVGRQVGIVITAMALLVSFLALTAFPLWSVVKMVLAALVLYCLVVRGDVARHHRELEVCRHT